MEVWTKLHTQEDINDLIAWLQMAKGTMRQWEKIHKRSLQIGPPKAMAIKDEKLPELKNG